MAKALERKLSGSLLDSPCLRVGKHVCGLQSQLGVGDVLNETARYKH